MLSRIEYFKYISPSLSLFYLRFVALSPIKTPQWPKHKAVTSGNEEVRKRLSDLKSNNIFGELEPASDVASSDRESVGSRETGNSRGSPQLVAKSLSGNCAVKNTDLIWKVVVLERYASC